MTKNNENLKLSSKTNERFVEKMRYDKTQRGSNFWNLVWEYSNCKGIHTGLVVPMDWIIKLFKSR